MASAIGGSRMARRSEKPQSTLIAFPRVGRSVSDQEYYMFNDEAESASPANIGSSSETADSHFGKRARINTRASKGSMMAFPRVGRSSPINKYEKIFGGSSVYDHAKRSYDQGTLVAIIGSRVGSRRGQVDVM